MHRIMRWINKYKENTIDFSITSLALIEYVMQDCACLYHFLRFIIFWTWVNLMFEVDLKLQILRSSSLTLHETQN